MSKDETQPDPFLLVKIQEIKARPVWSMEDLAIVTGMPQTSLRLQMERVPLKGAFTIGRRISFLQDAAMDWFESLQHEAAYVPRKNNRREAS